ncbi:hypothetical protein FQA39_LY12723 [Lamprigera yunnana]|nr:hypothetical protein FQA39_LY12723 [Lamprigera yunnana]
MSSTLRGKHLHAQAREMAFHLYQWIKSQNEDQCTKEIKEKEYLSFNSLEGKMCLILQGKIVEQNLSEYYNWCGKNKKPAFNRFKNIINFVVRVVRKNKFSRDATQQKLKLSLRKRMNATLQTNFESLGQQVATQIDTDFSKNLQTFDDSEDWENELLNEIVEDRGNTNKDLKDEESATTFSECEITLTPSNQCLNSVNSLKMLARKLGINKLNDMLCDIQCVRK